MASKKTTAGKVKRAGKLALDYASNGIRDVLKTMFPKPETDNVRRASAKQASLMKRYVKLREAEGAAKKAKEAVGNELCHAIGKDLGLKGGGLLATWDATKGTIDYGSLLRDESITAEKVELYRGEASRSLSVKASAS